MEISDQKSIVVGFAEALFEAMGSESSLSIAMSNFDALELSNPQKRVEGMEWSDTIQKNQKYDYITANMPIGMGRKNVCIGNTDVNVRRNWAELAKALYLLSDQGVCLALVEPPAFGIAEGPKYEQALNDEGYYLNGIFHVPTGLLEHTKIQPVLVVISKTKKNGVFVAELASLEQGRELATAFVAGRSGESLDKGLAIEPHTFNGFDSLKAKIQLSKLETQYKEYESVSLGEVTEAINVVRSGQEHEEKANSIYIPMLGTSNVTHDLSSARIKHHNLFQVILKDRANCEYVSAFFQSDLGKLVLDSLTFGAVIPKINKSKLLAAQIALPSLGEQQEIVFTYQRLTSLSLAIADFQTELALNPKSAAAIKSQLESMLEQIGGLTDTDKVMNIIRTGESKTVEFKESLSLDVCKGEKGKYIELSALKTIVAFLNTDGGTLLIGVSDAGKTLGIQPEVEKLHKNNKDAFLLHFRNLLAQRIGAQYYSLIDQRLVSLGGDVIFLVECQKASNPCYLDDKDFYVRTNPATDKLEGKKMDEYVRNRFYS
jgi:hypothetical protein